MVSDLLKPEIQEFINQNIGADVSKLALRKNPFANACWTQILNQISAKTKARPKLPTWFRSEGIIYPGKISVEQASSEKTAAYKSGIVSGKALIDLTGGFGVDDYYFAKKISNVTHCEIDAGLSEIVRHNFEKLQVRNIDFYSGDSTTALKNSNAGFDWIYIDPSRRNNAKGKVFMLKDCFPNVPELLGFYHSHSDNILIKTAPILDISAGLGELKNVKTIHIVAVENEVKELLWELSKGFSGAVQIKTVNLQKDKPEHFDFYRSDNAAPAATGLPKKYLYEPNGAIMKSGGFDEIGKRHGLEKLQQHSHLYTKDSLVDFPGRIFEIQHIISYTKNNMKKYLQNGKSNVTARNFPESVENIRKKWKIKDGGNQFCFFTTDANNHKIVLICSKI